MDVGTGFRWSRREQKRKRAVCFFPARGIILPKPLPVRSIYLGLLILLLSACDTPSATEASYSEGSLALDESIEIEPPRTAEPPPPPPTIDEEPAETTAPKIIYRAELVAQVNNLDSAIAAVTRMVTASGGYVSDQHRTNQRYRNSANLTVRLPADRLRPLLSEVPRLAVVVDRESLSSEDVTAEWVDLESRLATKREVRDRYVDILRNRAAKVEDILAAEDKIRVIIEEIEAQESRLRYLRGQVRLSTLHLQLYQEQEYRATGSTYAPSFASELGEALGAGGRAVRGLVIGLVALWPLWLVLGVVIPLLLRWWRGRRRARR